jgi:hypothetical protein
MNGSSQTWKSRAVWLMLAVSACWVAYAFASSYASCRADGTGKVGCVILALFAGWLQVLLHLFTTIIRLITWLLP